MSLTVYCSNHWISLADFILYAIDSDDRILKYLFPMWEKIVLMARRYGV